MEIAQLAGVFFEALMLGIFVMIYSKGTWLLIRGDQPTRLKRRNFFLLAANTVMLIASLTVSLMNAQLSALALTQICSIFP